MNVFAIKIVAFFTALFTFLFSIPSMSVRKNVDNVILFVGDGMGEMHIEMTKEMRNTDLIIDTLPQQGYAMTYSASSSVTDSAAGGTALATGTKTENGRIATYWPKMEGYAEYEGYYPLSITELCMKNGLKTGVITTDNLTGATPGAFTAHAESREDKEDIALDQLASGIDIIWGKDDSTVTSSQVKAAGYTYIKTIEGMNSLTGNEKSYGLFTESMYHVTNKNSYTPTLSQMTARAIELLDSTSENGFFLMVEGAHIDKRSHDQDEAAAAEALEEFDNAIELALEFAEADGRTLIVVTADHETGGVIINDNGEYEMTTGSHTSRNVPVRAYGPYSFVTDGEIINNIEVSVRIAAALGFEKGSIPAKKEIPADNFNVD